MKSISKYMMFGLAGLFLTSCLDTTVLPEDDIVGEEFWQESSQVKAMVAGAYRAMVSEDVVARFMVWGSYRSDDLSDPVANTSGQDASLKRLNTGNMEQDNSWADWASIYQVINRCNIVLEKGRAVVDIDPSYDLSTYQRDESQMLALRALCYFYLVRAYRDVPYTAEAYMNSSMPMKLPQSSPEFVLGKVIEDLQAALEHPISPSGYDDWRKQGLMNADAIRATLADVYLWRASMFSSNADYSAQVADDYRRAAAMAEEVIQSRIDQDQEESNGGNGMGRFPGAINTGSDNETQYPLYEGTDAYRQIFINGNSKESIFELQLDGTNNVNIALRKNYLCNNGSNLGTMRMSAPLKFGTYASSPIETDGVFYSESDYRFYEACFDLGSSTDRQEFIVRKMVDIESTQFNNDATTRTARSFTNNLTALGREGNLGRFAQNWIVYRLTDVMLMRAEALVQLGGDDNLKTAYALVREVNKRAFADQTKALPEVSAYETQAEMEKLVLAERQRELCFEGKRWFDLLRFNYRHISGVEPGKILAEIGQKRQDFVDKGLSNSADFEGIIQNKYNEGGSSIVKKINCEPYLYLPVPYSDMQVNDQLRQNPVYIVVDEFSSKNGK